MSAWLEQLFTALSPLWRMSLTGAYVAGIVFFLRLLLKGRAPRQAVCLLWLIVFARLLIPLSLQSPFSAVPQALAEGARPAVSQSGAQQAPAPILENNPAVPQTDAPGDAQGGPQTGNPAQSVGQDDPAAVAPLPEQPQSGDSPVTSGQAQQQAAFPWRALVAGVWLAGAAAMLGYALLSWLLLRRRLFDAVRAEDGAWEHPDLASPFLLGIFRPRIYLPAHLPARTRFFVLRHERCHLRRLDHIVKPVCWAALALHWFNPLAWLAFLLLSRDLESACDQAVLRQLGERYKGDYSAALLSCATGRKFPAPCPLGFGDSGAGGRIRSVLHYKKPAFWALAGAVVVVILAAVVLLTDPMAEQPGPDATDGAPASASPEPSATLPDGAELLFENQGDGLAIYREARSPYTAYLVDGGLVYELPEPTVDTVTDLRLTDLDGDGAQELAITGVQLAGAGGHGVLTVLERENGQWDVEARARLAMDSELGGRLVDDVLANAALRYEQGSPWVTVSLGYQQFVTLTVGDGLAQRRGTYRLEDGWQSATLFWWEDVPYVRLVLPLLFQPDPGEGERTPAGVGVEAVLRLNCDSQGLFTLDLEALLPACGQLSTLPAALSGGENGVSRSGDTGLPVYHEDSLTLLSFHPNLDTSLYALPDGALVLRSGSTMGPLPEGCAPSDTLALESVDDRGLTFRRSGGDGAPQAVTRLEFDPETAAWREVFAVRFPQGHTGDPYLFENETFTFSTPQGETPFQASGLFGDGYTRTYRADLDGDGVDEYLFLPASQQDSGYTRHNLYVFRQGAGGWESLDAGGLWPGFEAASLTADEDSFYITAPGDLSAAVSKSELLGRFPDLELNDTLALGGSRYVQLYGGRVVLNQALLAGSSPQTPEVEAAILRAPLVLERGRPALGPLSLQYNYTYVPSYA